MNNPRAGSATLSFLDTLLVDLKKREANATKKEYRRSGAHVDPRPAPAWDERPWVPTSLVIRTHVQRCITCDSTSETLVGYFLRSEAPDGPERRVARMLRVECAHPTLPEVLETTEEDVRKCPLCIRLSALLDPAGPEQLPLFATHATR